MGNPYYEAGYEHGMEKNSSGFEAWIRTQAAK